MPTQEPQQLIDSPTRQQQLFFSQIALHNNTFLLLHFYASSSNLILTSSITRARLILVLILHKIAFAFSCSQSAHSFLTFHSQFSNVPFRFQLMFPSVNCFSNACKPHYRKILRPARSLLNIHAIFTNYFISSLLLIMHFTDHTRRHFYLLLI